MKTAVVTGASSGIGEATARRLAAEGFKVICAARRFERIAALAEQVGGIAVACDVTQDVDVTRLADAVGDHLDLLVNNAGGAIGLEPVTEADVAAWQRCTTSTCHVNIDRLTVRPRAQAGAHKLYRIERS